MALKFDPRVELKSTPTSTGVATFTVSGVSEIPVGAVIECTRTTTDATEALDVSMSRGFTDGTNDYCGSHCEEDGSDPVNAFSRGTDTALVYLMDPSDGSALIVATFDSFVAGGIKLNFTTVEGTARDLLIQLYFGSDTECKAFRVPQQVGGGASTTISCGFEPGFVHTDVIEDTDETVYDDFNMQAGLGGPTAMSGFCTATSEHDEATSVSRGGTLQGICFRYDVGSVPTTGGHSSYLANFDTDGFDCINFPGATKAATPVVIGLAVRPSTGRVEVEDLFAIPTSTGDQVIDTGWRPGFIEFMVSRAITANIYAGGSWMSVGACEVRQLASSCFFVRSNGGQAASDCATMRSAILVDLWSASGGTHLWEGDVSERDATSLTIDWTTVAGTARLGHYIIVEDVEGDTDGSSAGAATVAGTLVGTGAVAGTSAGAATGSGSMVGAGVLAGVAAGVASASGTLIAGGVMAGASAGSAAATGTLDGAAPIEGAAAGAATAAGNLVGLGALAGTAAGVATVSGTLEGAGVLAGVSAGAATAAGTLSASGALSGASAGAATTDGALEGLGALGGLTAGLATFAGDLVNATAGTISGSAAGAASVTGALSGAGVLAGLAAGAATVSGSAMDVTKGCFETLGVVARTILQESVVDLFPGTLPVIYSNEIEVDGSGIPIRPEGSHVEADIVSGPNELVATTGRTHAYRKEGMLRARTFVVADSSWGGASDIAKRIEDAFTSALVNSVRFGAATTRAAGRAGAFFVLETDCPFVAFEKLARPLSAGDGNPDLDDCFAAIESRLWAQVLAASGIQVGWPNITFAPPNALHALVTHQPGTRIRQERGLESHTRPGITTVDLFAPIGDGDAAAVELGDTIVETMSSVRQDGVVLEAANLERLGRAGPYYLVSIACTWRADTVST